MPSKGVRIFPSKRSGERSASPTMPMRVAGTGSRVVFDYVQSSVLRNENTLYGERGAARTVSRAGEQWRFGLEPQEIPSFVAAYGFVVSDHKCACELEAAYFRGPDGTPVGRINGTHCLVTAESDQAPPAVAPQEPSPESLP